MTNFTTNRALQSNNITLYKARKRKQTVGKLHSFKNNQFLYTVHAGNTTSPLFRSYITDPAPEKSKLQVDQAVTFALQNAWESVYNGFYEVYTRYD